MPAPATTTTAPAKTIITVRNSAAPFLRIKAKIDFPEYGVHAGDVVYLVRCSANDGTYYVVRFEGDAWVCPCEGNAKFRRTCKHIKTASSQSKLVAERAISRPVVVAPLVEKQLTALALAIPGGTTKPDRVPVPIARPSRDRAEAPLQRQGFSILRTPGRGKQTQQASAFVRHFEE